MDGVAVSFLSNTHWKIPQIEGKYIELTDNGDLQQLEVRWHIRYTGGYAGRIFFYPVPNKKIFYIGHIGHKLPTVRYH